MAQNPLHKRLMNTQELVFDLKARVAKQEAIIEDLQDQLEAVSARLDNQPSATETNKNHHTDPNQDELDSESEDALPTRGAFDSDDEGENEEDNKPSNELSILSQMRQIMGSDDE